MARRAPLSPLFAAVIMILGYAATTSAHGYLEVPKARNLVARDRNEFWDVQSGNGLGLSPPPGNPDPSGGPFQGTTRTFMDYITPSQATWTAGQEVELSVYITANHGGRFEFRVCPRSTNIDDACLGSNYLTNAIPGDFSFGDRSFWIRAGSVPSGAARFGGLRFKLPAGVSCPGGCVLQWRYVAMQSCIERYTPSDRIPPDYATGSNGYVGNNPGWCSVTGAQPQAEFFNNLADITILAAGSPGAPPPSPVAPSPSPAVPAPSPAAPSPAPAKPSPSPAAPSPSPAAPSPSPAKPSPSPAPAPRSPSPAPSPAPSGTWGTCNGCTTPACFCRPRPSGIYANPFDSTCGTFVQCANGNSYVKRCQSGLVYDPRIGACNWPSAAPCAYVCTAAPLAARNRRGLM